jgi:5-hydroxyisourate hydrolase-like protein (transthyretin family)
VGLYRLNNGQWKEITRFNTETDGGFRITRKLTSGSYELRVLDKRYDGKTAVTLTSEPVRNLILQAMVK